MLQLFQERLSYAFFFGRGKGGGINRVHHGLCENGENTSREPPTLSVNLSVICFVELIHLI